MVFINHTQSHQCTFSYPYLQGFQGKTGPPGPTGVVGPQVSTCEPVNMFSNEIFLLHCSLCLHCWIWSSHLCDLGQIRWVWPNRGPRSPRCARSTWRARFTWICWKGRWKGGSSHTVSTDHHHYYKEMFFYILMAHLIFLFSSGWPRSARYIWEERPCWS